MIAFFRIFYAFKKAFSGNSDQILGFFTDLAHFNAGSWEVDWMDDDWTVVTRDRSLSAHYENTILITDGEPRILSLTEDTP